MKREIKAEQKNQDAQSAENVNQANKATAPPSKRAKIAGANGQIFEKTIQAKPFGTVFEEKKGDLVVIPLTKASALATSSPPVQKKAITDARATLLEPMKPKKISGSYVFFATEHSAILRNEKNFTVVEAMRGAGAAWNKMSDEEKQKYVLMAQKDAER